MQALNTNQDQARHANVPEYNYPIAPQKRRSAFPRKPVQSEQMPNGEAHTGVLRHTIAKRGRYWNVIDPLGRLVCVTVYKCGAKEVIRRLDARQMASNASLL